MVFGILFRMILSAYRRVARLPWEKISHGLLLVFLMIAVLWRGGRTLEMTWALVGVTWVIWAVEWMRCASAERRALSRTLSVLVWLYVLWVVMSFATSSVQNYGLDEVFRTVSLALLFFWMARQPDGSSIRRRVLKAIAVAALLAVGIGVAVYLLQPVSRFVGTFFDMRRVTDYWPNAWAEFVLLTWPIVLLFTYRKSPESGPKMQRFTHLILQAGPLGLLLTSLALSYSRAAALVLLGQAVLLALWGIRRQIVWRKYVPFMLGTFVVVLLMFAGCNELRARRFPVTSAVDKVLFQTEEGTSTLTERVDFWRQAVVLSREHPLLGFGPGSFRFVQPRIARGFLAVSDHPHNLFLKAALDSGWPAAVLLLAILLLLVLPSLRALVPRSWCSDGRGGRWMLSMVCPGHLPDLPAMHFLPFLGVIGVLGHNLIDFNLQYVGIALPVVLLLAMMVETREPALKLNNKFVQSTGLILASILLFLAVREGIFITTQILARRAEERGAFETALTWYRRSHASWYPRDLRLGEGRLLIALQLPEEAQDAAQIALAMNVYDARVWELLADAQVITGDRAGAPRSAVEAYRFGRMIDIATTRLFVDLLLQEDREATLRRLPEFDALAGIYAAAMQRNAHFVLLSGNVEEFLRILDVLSVLSPADEPRFQGMAAGVARMAKEARSQHASALQGLLW